MGVNHDICECCLDNPKLNLNNPWMVIAVHRPHEDDRIAVFLFHRWDVADTTYYVFGRLTPLLGILPPNPFLAIIFGHE